MVTYSGTNQTGIDAGGILQGGTTRPAGGLRDARVKCVIDFYTIAGSELSGSVIKLFGVLPTGANLLEIVLNFSAAQSSLTLSIGDADSATRYVSASTGPQTAGITRVSLLGRVVGTSTYDNQILLTTGGATATAATLTGYLIYTTD